MQLFDGGSEKPEASCFLRTHSGWMAPQSPLAKCRWVSRGSTAAKGCTRLCVEVWLQHKAGQEQRACLLPLVPPHCLPHHMCWGVWWWHTPTLSSSLGQNTLQMQTCTDVVHTPVLGCWATTGCNRNRPPEKRMKLQPVRRVMERAGEQRENAEQESSWLPFFSVLFFKWKMFYASSSNVRGAAEVLKEKREP